MTPVLFVRPKPWRFLHLDLRISKPQIPAIKAQQRFIPLNHYKKICVYINYYIHTNWKEHQTQRSPPLYQWCPAMDSGWNVPRVRAGHWAWRPSANAKTPRSLKIRQSSTEQVMHGHASPHVICHHPPQKKTWFSVTSIIWEYAKYILEYCRFPHLRLKSVDSLRGGDSQKSSQAPWSQSQSDEVVWDVSKKGSQTSKVLPMGKVPRNVGMHLRTLMHR